MTYRILPLLIALVAATAASAQDLSAEFLATWKQAAGEPARSRAAWDAFAKKHPRRDLGEVAKLLTGIAALREGDPAAAMPYFVVAAPSSGEPTALHKQVIAGGKALGARARMSLVTEQLQAYYRKHVEYPASLDDLVAAKLARPEDLTDAAGPPGTRFVYEPRARKTAPGVPRQTYTLRSEAAGVESGDLAAAVRGVYEPVPGITISSLEPARGQAFIKTPRPDGTLGGSSVWTIGQARGDLTLWAVYESYVLVGAKGFPRVIVKEG